MLLLSCFSRVRLCVTPETAAHQAPLSLGFSRQEHWSGLPFPSPMQESEKWSCSVASDSSRPHGLQPPRLLRPWDFPGKSTRVGCHCLLQCWVLNFWPNSQCDLASKQHWWPAGQDPQLTCPGRFPESLMLPGPSQLPLTTKPNPLNVSRETSPTVCPGSSSRSAITSFTA